MDKIHKATIKVIAPTGIIIIVIMLAGTILITAYAGGPRLDADERYSYIPEAGDCWVDGYDAGFANKYDKDRADECNEIPGDQYNASWGYGCVDSGLTKAECDDIRENDDEDLNHESLYEENTQRCYDDGYEDGQNNPYDHERDFRCDEFGSPEYYDGFIAGCVDADNTKEICENFTDVSG